MRINVYSQELTKEVALVWKDSDNGKRHYGVRIFIASPPVLHHTPDDDAESAITFWIPNCGEFKPRDLGAIFERIAHTIYINIAEIESAATPT